MDDLLIIRPTVRSARWQTIAGTSLAAACIAGASFFEGASELRVAILVAVSTLAMAVIIQRHLRLRGPRAIVATPDYLGFLTAQGERRLVRWDVVQGASHSTDFAGMRWKLRSPDGVVAVRDVGVDPEQWERLWRRVGSEVSRRDRPVFVDRISDALFD